VCYLALSVFFLLGDHSRRPSYKRGTTIVFIRAHNRLWIGADSLVLQLKTGEKQNVCKIHRSVGNVYFVLTGTTELGGYFDAVSEADKSVRDTGNAILARDQFAKRMIPLFQKAIPAMRKYYPAEYSSNWEQPDPRYVFFQAAFFDIKQGVAYAETVSFKIKRGQGVRTVVSEQQNCPGSCDESGSLTPLGKNKAFQPPFDPASLQPFGPPETIRRMISMEIAAEPNYVGGNIDILQLDALGGKFLTNNPECNGRTASTKSQTRFSNTTFLVPSRPD